MLYKVIDPQIFNDCFKILQSEYSKEAIAMDIIHISKAQLRNYQQQSINQEKIKIKKFAWSNMVNEAKKIADKIQINIINIERA